MTEEIKLYRIEEFCTTGWELIADDAVKLTKEQCDQQLQEYLNLGYSPKRMRAVLDN